MYISKMSIEGFRAFQSKFELDLNKNITVISGLNGIGKSTLLALLTNTSELKKAKPFIKNNFRGDFPDVILFDQKTDKAGSQANFTFDERPELDDEHYPETLTYRSAIQKSRRIRTSYKYVRTEKDEKLYKEVKTPNVINRFRFIPAKRLIDGKKTEAKISWPTLYLGLSRAFPTGENETANITNLPDDIQHDLISQHAHILSENIDTENSSLSIITGSEATQKNTGINTTDYGATTNSSGQGNLGQIILAVKSFEQLKKDLGKKYIGGLLAIDEIDTTLHAAAQNKLFDYLLKKSQDLSLQIVVTSHSISLLEHVSNITQQNNQAKIVYLTRDYSDNGEVREFPINPQPDFFKNNLNEVYNDLPHATHSVTALTEDATAEWFLRSLIRNSDFNDLESLHFSSVNLDWQKLVNLSIDGGPAFRELITFVDPDVSLNENRKILDKLLGESSTTWLLDDILFILPGTNSIEKLMWEFISSQPASASIWREQDFVSRNVNLSSLCAKGPDSSNYKDDKNKFKHWFADNGVLKDIIIRYWITNNKQEVSTFLAHVNKSFERLRNK